MFKLFEFIIILSYPMMNANLVDPYFFPVKLFLKIPPNKGCIKIFYQSNRFFSFISKHPVINDFISSLIGFYFGKFNFVVETTLYI